MAVMVPLMAELVETEVVVPLMAEPVVTEVMVLMVCSGQQKLATDLEFFQNNRSDSFGIKSPLY